MATRQAHARWEGTLCDGSRDVKSHEGSFRIGSSHLVCEARVPGIDAASFPQQAEKAKANCPVSKALAGTQITLEATRLGK
jgi:osmotically inducible protein OsmC